MVMLWVRQRGFWVSWLVFRNTIVVTILGSLHIGDPFLMVFFELFYLPHFGTAFFLWFIWTFRIGKWRYEILDSVIKGSFSASTKQEKIK